MMYDLFSSGDIYLVRSPVNGNCGIPSLYGRVLDGSLGIDVITELREVYVVFSTRNRLTLLILHVDQYGVDLTKRRIFKKKFRIMLEDSGSQLKITREQLKRLVLDGTYEAEWQDPVLQRQIEAFLTAGPQPGTTGEERKT